MRDAGISGRFEVVANPVDCSVFLPPEDAPDPELLQLVCVARLASVKGHEVLIDAVARVAASFPQVRLTFVGDGPIRAELEQRCRTSGIADRVTFAGRLPPEQVAERLRSAHAFVLASRFENLCVAVLEACVTGLPVVTTRVGGMAEIDSHGMRLVEPGDPDALADALVRTLSNLPTIAERHRIAEMARARYSTDAIGSRVGELYSSVLRADHSATRCRATNLVTGSRMALPDAFVAHKTLPPLSGSWWQAQVVRQSLFEFAGGRRRSSRWPPHTTLDAWKIPSSIIRSRIAANTPSMSNDQPPTGRKSWAAHPADSESCADQTHVLRLHAGNGDMSDLGRRFVDCFESALDDASLPDDPRFRSALLGYMRWAVDEVLQYGSL